MDREQIRARAEAARGLQSTRAQQEDFNHNALFDILALLAAIDELTGFVDDAKAEAVEWERTSQQVAIDRAHWKGVAARRHELVLEVAKQLDAKQAHIDDLEVRNAKLEAVAEDDVRDMANFCIAQGASKPWQEIARRLLAALDALDG
jgi:hypothetical protein